mmetsp:Transcript_36374/g.80963  ORF Transcript_36374/g.80963 Transcript_36374/m.80963 type:complete len:315 (+) Transcript_36374:233-1177(+)
MASDIGSNSLLTSLRRTVESTSCKTTSDVRFEFGTDYNSNFRWPPEDAYNYRPLLVTHAEKDASTLAKHLTSRSGLFPRLDTSVEEVKGKLKPVVTELVTRLKRKDVHSSGYVSHEDLQNTFRETGVFMSKADMEALLTIAPHSPDGRVDYPTLIDIITGKLDTALSSIAKSRPDLPPVFEWPSEQGLLLTLRLRDTAAPYEVSAERMHKYAKKATAIRTHEPDAEKVHNLLRHFLLEDLLISPGRPGHPDLSFRQWLMNNGVLSLTMTSRPGPIPPEVYDVLDQIVYSIGVPPVVSATMTTTALGASLRQKLN